MSFTSSVLRVVTLGLFFSIQCNGYRILGVFPMPAPSHYFLGSALMKGLAEAGHDVTILSPFTLKTLPKNGTWREIVLHENEAIFKDAKLASRGKGFNPFTMMLQFFNRLITLSETTLSHPEVQALIHSNEKFDAVIVSEMMWDSLKALAPHFNAHLISFSNSGAFPFYYQYVGNHVLPSHFPEAVVGFSPNMTFIQRIINTLVRGVRTLIENFLLYPSHEAIVKKFFPNGPIFKDILYNSSLVLVNSDVSISSPQPKVPMMIDIGGFHLKPPGKLPKDLQEFMDKAKDGVIYFSMGSHIKSEDLPPEKIESIVKALGKRKELVFWKWGQDTFPGKPENVVLGKWFPQQEILAHPNLKLFVTHGGFLSTTETIYHGVPTVAVPIIGDQVANAKIAEQAGYGKVVLIEDLTVETFGGAVEEVISNPKYREIVKLKSRIMKDRIKPPMEVAVFWVEYVIRNDGAKYLMVPYIDMPFYQFYLLDVLVTLLFIVVIVIWLLKKLLSLVIGLFTKRGTKVKTS